MSKKAIIISIIIIAIVLVAIFGVYYISKWRKAKEQTGKGLEGLDIGVDLNVGVDVGEIGKGTENVLKNMPATNPLEEVANPFRDAYKNPFK